MRNEWVDFRAVKASVSLAEVLRAYGVDWLRTRRPGQLEGRCPIHQGDRVDAFHVRVSQNAFHCFACQAGGNVLDFVAAMERCSVREAARRLAQRFPVSALQPGSVAGEKGNWLGKKEGDNRPLSFILRGVDRSHAYLRARGISPETAALFGVGFYAGPGVMSGRVVIPIHDPRGRLVAYAGRSLDGAPPKYRLPAGFRKSLLLFNFHRAAARDEQTVGVVEGYFDCLKIHQAGFRCVVALMGTVLSGVAETLLLARFRKVILMLDGDDRGRQASQRIAAQLAGRCSVRLAWLPGGKQPDQLNREEIRALLRPGLDDVLR